MTAITEPGNAAKDDRFITGEPCGLSSFTLNQEKAGAKNRHRVPILAAAFVLLALAASAYPPAPDHTFYGLARNEWGDPINVSGAKIFIQSTNGAGANAVIATSTQPGINYRLIVPMDSARSPKIE